MAAFEFDEASAKPVGEFDQQTAKPVKTTSLQKAADVGRAFLQGAAGGAQALTDFAGAGNPASNALESARNMLASRMTPERQAQVQARQKIIKDAEATGSTLEEIKAQLGGLAEAPASTIAQGAGSIIPTAAAALLTRGRSLAAPTAIGAAQGAGAVKGTIYDDVRDAHVQAGKTPEQAQAAAEAAQAYTGPNKRDILIGAGLGAVAGSSGVETALSGAQRTAARTMLRRTVVGGAQEMVTEGAQGAQERIAGNLAQQREGFPVPTLQGAVGQGVLEGVVGGIIGGGVSAASPDQAAPAPRPIEPPKTQPPAVSPPQGVQTGGFPGDSEPDEPAFDPSTARPVATPTPASGILGIDPAQGPLSTAAAKAVDSGATITAQQRLATQQADEEAKKGKPGEAKAEPVKPPKPVEPPPAQPVTGPLTAALAARVVPQGAPNAQAQAQQAAAGSQPGAATDARAAGGIELPPAQQAAGVPEPVPAPAADTRGSTTGAIEPITQQESTDAIQAATPIQPAPDASGAQTPADAQADGQGAPAAAGPSTQPDVGPGQSAAPASVSAAPEGGAVESAAPVEDDRKAQLLKRISDGQRLMPTGMASIGGLANGRVNFNGDPRSSKQSRALSGAVDEAIAAGATPQEIVDAALRPPKADTVDAAAHANAAASPLNDRPQPTPAQIGAGNYPKGHVSLSGVELSIENPEGSTRRSKPTSPVKWETTMKNGHYGYVKGSVGMDGDHVDVFVKPGTPLDHSGDVYVIDQVDPKTGKPDEHKVMIGYKNGLEARQAYQGNYQKGWTGAKAVTPMTWDQFKAWVFDTEWTKKPAADLAEAIKYAQIDGRMEADREALKGLKVGDEVEFTDKGPFTQPDGSSIPEKVRSGKISKIIDKKMGLVEVGNYTLGASMLRKVGGTEEKLPEGSFMDPNLPVNTGANARMVVIEKAATEPSQLVAREPEAPYSGGYETDLFGSPVPAPARRPARAGSDTTGLRGDAQPATPLSDVAPIPGDYFTRTIVGSESERELGASKILTPAHAAQATQYLYKSAVERFDAIVTDANDVPLAVVGGFKGAISQTSVYPATIMLEAMRVPGAAKIWFSHNHPSGLSSLSRADEMLNNTMSEVFKGSGVEPMGLLAIGGNRFSFSGPFNKSVDSGAIPNTVVRKKVPVIERQLDPVSVTGLTISSLSDAKKMAIDLYSSHGKPGIALLSAQHSLVAWIPTTETMKGKLRGGALGDIYRAISHTNAGAAVIVHGGELDAGPFGIEAWENIARALRAIDVRPLDVVNAKTRKSVAETSLSTIGAGPAFARGGQPFYSALEREISGVNAKAQPALGWTATITGLVKAGKVKQDEVEWSGVLDWLRMQARPQTVWEPGFGLVEEMQNDRGEWEQVDDLGMYFRTEAEARAAITDDLRADAERHGKEEGTPARIGINAINKPNLNLGKTEVRKVTREQLVAFLGENGVKVTETKLGSDVLNAPGSQERRQELEDMDDEDFADEVGEWIGVEYEPGDDRDDLIEKIMREEGSSFDERRGDEAGMAKYGQRQLPGGTNYREVLLTLPTMPAQKRWEELHAKKNRTPAERAEFLSLASQQTSYKSGHWDQPNVLAHIRVNDRTDADGKRVLFVEEIQSDWAQKGRKEGFGSMGVQVFPPPANDRWAKWEAKTTGGRHLGWVNASSERGALLEARRLFSNELSNAPPAPFVGKTDAWVSLALKRIIKMAADEGYDKVAFVTGEQSEDRYWGNDVVRPAVERWNEVTKPQSIRELGEDVLGREMASLVALDHVDAGVLAVLKHDQVRRAVVEAIPVDVVNMLRAENVSPDELLRKKDVIASRLSIDSRRRAADGIVGALRLTGASVRAKLGSLTPSSGDIEVLPALRASQLNTREVAGLLDPVRLFHRGAGGSPEGAASARAGAKPLPGKDGRGFGGEQRAAELAGLLNSHAAILGRDGLLTQGVEPPPGEGMRAFYDKIVPSVLKDVLRKVGGGQMQALDVRVESDNPDAMAARIYGAGTTYRSLPFESKARVDEQMRRGTKQQPGFDITPAMRERAAGGLPMFDRQGDLLRTLRAAVGGQSVEQVQAIVNEVASKWSATVKVVATPDDLPIPAPADARGLHYKGTIYVVASTNRTRALVLKTLGHEAIAHYGLRGMLGREEWRKLMARINTLAKMGNGPLREIQAYVRRTYVDDDGTFNLSETQEADEIAARAVEQGIDPKTGEFRPGFGWLKAVFAKIAEFLRGLGVTVPFTNLELQGALVNAQAFLSREGQLAGSLASALSRAPGFFFNAEQSPLYQRRTAQSVGVISKEQADQALASDAVARRIMAKGIEVQEGDRVGARLNINVLKNTGVAVNTIHRGKTGDGVTKNRGWWGGEVIAYAPVVTLTDAYFNVDQKAREGIAMGQQAKAPMASIDGKFTKAHSFDGVEFRFNPKREHLFRDALGRVLKHADRVTISGNSAYAQGEIEYYGAEDVPARAGDAPSQGRLLQPGDNSGTPAFSRTGERLDDDKRDPANPAPYIAQVLRDYDGQSAESGWMSDQDAFEEIKRIVDDSNDDVPGIGPLRQAIEAAQGAVDEEYERWGGRGDSMRDVEAVLDQARDFAGGAQFARGGDQTQTPEFKAWFGDSKVVDAEGKPLVVYHGAPDARFAKTDGIFRSTRNRLGFTQDPQGDFWFASSRRVAETYADDRRAFDYQNAEAGVIAAYIKLENPLVVDAGGQLWRTAQQRGKTSDVIEEAKAAGHDGVIIRNVRDDYSRLDKPRKGEVTTTFTVFRPEQIKSATDNVGTFDPGNPDIRYARGDAAKQVVTDVLRQAGNKAVDYRSIALGALGRRQIVDLYGREIPQLRAYNQLMQAMDADKNEAGAEADGIADRWGKLKDQQKLAELMHDATLAQIDAALPFVPGDDPQAYQSLSRAFAALSEDAQALYREARNAYSQHHENVRKAIRDRIMRSAMSAPRKAELMMQMDAEFFRSIKGVYFPLARFGDYVVVVRDAQTGRALSVSRAETMNEAEALQAQLRKAFPDAVVGRVLKDKEFNAGRDMVGRGFMDNLYEALGRKDMDDAQRAELEDMLGQLYLSALPDLSWAKHGIHRKGMPGFSQDARRAFAQNMFHGARYLAKVRYSDLLENQLFDAQKQVEAMAGLPESETVFDSVRAQQVLDEMVKRHDAAMNPVGNPLSTALTSLGFVFHLGLSPAAAMVNMTQTALVAYPVMGAKWGFDRAAGALLTASKQAATNRNDISKVLEGDEKRAYDEAVRSGVIDVTMAHDLAGIAQGEDDKVTWKLRPIMRWASFLFHHAERFNRQVTFVAAYRLARESGTQHIHAYAQAVQATYDGHFDYSATNRPRFMQGNVAKVVLLFKQYAQNMIYTLGRQAFLATKGASPAQRKQARKALGGLLAMHAAAAGVLGLPLVGTLLTVASWIGSDDDEPWDAEVAMRNALADTFGDAPADAMARGLSRLTPFDISGRVGLDKLIFPDIQEGLEGQRWAESFMSGMLGPVAGIGVNAVKGMAEISEGEWARGLEAMMPTVLRGPLKALRYGQEGAIDRTGKPILEDVNDLGIIGQALGLSPSDVRLATEAKGAIHQADMRLNKRRAQLLRQFSLAAVVGDEEAMRDGREAIERFNQVNSARRITPLNMAQSIRRRRLEIEQSQGGVYLPRNRQDAFAAGQFGMDQ